jgi:hypothetical protein
MPPTPAAAPALTTDSICNNHGTNQKKSQTMMDNDKKTKNHRKKRHLLKDVSPKGSSIYSLRNLHKFQRNRQSDCYKPIKETT